MKTTALLRRSFLLAPLLLGLMMQGCGDSSEEGKKPSLEKIFDNAQIKGCGTCHGPGGEQSDGPDLSTPAAFRSSLIGKSSADYPDWLITSPCNDGLKYIVPGKPDESALLAAIVQSKNKGRCDGAISFHAPLNATIDGNAELVADLVSWIEDGAK